MNRLARQTGFVDKQRRRKSPNFCSMVIRGSLSPVSVSVPVLGFFGDRTGSPGRSPGTRACTPSPFIIPIPIPIPTRLRTPAPPSGITIRRPPLTAPGASTIVVGLSFTTRGTISSARARRRRPTLLIVAPHRGRRIFCPLGKVSIKLRLHSTRRPRETYLDTQAITLKVPSMPEEGRC